MNSFKFTKIGSNAKMECNPQMNLVIQDGETPNKRVESSLSSKKKGGQPTSEVI